MTKRRIWPSEEIVALRAALHELWLALAKGWRLQQIVEWLVRHFPGDKS